MLHKFWCRYTVNWWLELVISNDLSGFSITAEIGKASSFNYGMNI